MKHFNPTWPKILFLVNAGATLMLLLIYTAIPHVSVKDFLLSWLWALISANAAAIGSILLMPPVMTWWVRKKRPVVPVVIAGILILTAFGSLLAQAGLYAARNAAWLGFWRQYLRTLQVASPFALAFGLGVFFWASLRNQLFEAQQKLHEKEIGEERTRKLALEARLRSLEARIHPHFLFNTLNSISALIATDPVRAEMMVGRLAAMLRSLLDRTNAPLIPLGDEIAIVADYVEIEKARAGSKLRVELQIPDELRDVPVPPLAVQSLVENAVKHGIMPERNGGDVMVTANASDGRVTIQVADSGRGFDLTSVPPGHGLDNLVGRLDALFGDKAGITVHPKEGYSVVEMTVPRR